MGDRLMGSHGAAFWVSNLDRDGVLSPESYNLEHMLGESAGWFCRVAGYCRGF